MENRSSFSWKEEVTGGAEARRRELLNKGAVNHSLVSSRMGSQGKNEQLSTSL